MKEKIQLKMYLVKREVMARNMKDAIKARGTVYEIQLAANDAQPLPEKGQIGFVANKKK